MAPDPSRGRCVAVAHVHHDCGKMEMYNEKIGSADERFFCDPEAVESWLQGWLADAR